jgi:hypothetical protein
MIYAFHQRYGHYPLSLAADTGYGNGEMLNWLLEREITPYVPVKEAAPRTELYGIEKFTYQSENDRYICPQGKPLKYLGINQGNRAHVYHSTAKRCRDCPVKADCTKGQYRIVAVHIHEAARQRAHEIAKTPAFAKSLWDRRKVEALFAELKNRIGLRRLRLRRLKFAREQFYLAATVQNMKRLVRFLTPRATEPAPATA